MYLFTLKMSGSTVTDSHTKEAEQFTSTIDIY